MFQHYAKFYDQIYKDKPYKQEIEFVYNWAGKPKSILDIGAGTANYWKYYPKGTKIIGVEKSFEMIARSKNRFDIIEGAAENTLVFGVYDCVTAIFDVINYIPCHEWWKNLPLKKSGYFIFDIWNKRKVDQEGFKQTIKSIGGIIRIINPLSYDGKKAKLNVTIANKDFEEVELHTLYIYSEADIERFCGKKFEIVDKKETKTWQTWWKLKRL